MKTIIGPAAEGEFYFDRQYLDKIFWKKMQESHNVSIAAPRRVGKTSFMMNLLKNQENGYKCIYLITESVNSSNEFFKKIYKTVLTQVSKSVKFKTFFESLFQRLEIKKISASEIEFGKSGIDYFNEILFLCRELKDFPEKIVLLIDEFSQTIENIITDINKEAAKNFLHQCRELRQNPEIKSKISFVYTGSIGLENLVLSIEEPRAISDLGSFDIPPLSEKEATELISQIIDNENYEFNDDDRNYFFTKLKWMLPYFIHVMMSEIENICTEKGSHKISADIIDKAFIHALRNRSYFEHWLVRLRSIFKGVDFTCAKEILNIAAKEDGIDYYELHNLIAKHKIVDTAVILNTLLHDGYIIKDEVAKKYRFTSPLLQSWWLSNIVI